MPGSISLCCWLGAARIFFFGLLLSGLLGCSPAQALPKRSPLGGDHAPGALSSTDQAQTAPLFPTGIPPIQYTPTGTEDPNESPNPVDLPAFSTPTPEIKHYYVDSAGGSDDFPGTTEEQPWQTLAPVENRKFSPGTVIHFKRGSKWVGGLTFRSSGKQGKPILLTAYGEGDRPVIENPGADLQRAITIQASWVIVEGFRVQNAHEAGVYIWSGKGHNTVRNIEAVDVGIGIAVHGQNNLITRNDIHDLHMVKNTPTSDGDYGAVGIWIFNSDNEISYNRIARCIAQSYDYGVDGGAIEWWGWNAINNRVHHNWAIDNKGFLEVGGGRAGNSIVSYNVSINNGRFSWIHLNDRFASKTENFRIENNTIVEKSKSSEDWVIFGFTGKPGEDSLIVQNNIIVADGFKVIASFPSFTHRYNLFNTIGVEEIGFEPGEGEITAEPLFVDPAKKDFHLRPDSPAIDAGVDLRYTLDFDNLPVPSGSRPDFGAYEYQESSGDK